MLGAATAIIHPGAQKSRHATVCETDEGFLYALGSRPVFVITFFTQETEGK